MKFVTGLLTTLTLVVSGMAAAETMHVDFTCIIPGHGGSCDVETLTVELDGDEGMYDVVVSNASLDDSRRLNFDRPCWEPRYSFDLKVYPDVTDFSGEYVNGKGALILDHSVGVINKVRLDFYDKSDLVKTRYLMVTTTMEWDY